MTLEDRNDIIKYLERYKRFLLTSIKAEALEEIELERLIKTLKEEIHTSNSAQDEYDSINNDPVF